MIKLSYHKDIKKQRRYILIVLIGGEKGGVGKTTLCTNLASMLVEQGDDTLLIDTDIQGSASSWCAIRDSNKNLKRIPCIQKFKDGLANEIVDLSKRYKHIIVDAGGRNSIELRSAMSVADKLFIPLQASQFDVWTIATMDVLVSQAKQLNTKLQAFIIINRASTHPSVTEAKDVMELFEDIEHVKMLDYPLRERIAYRRAAQQGLSIHELDKPDPKAIKELNDLFQEVIR